MRLHFVKGGKPGIRSDGERQGSHLLLRRKYCRKAFDARLTACISAISANSCYLATINPFMDGTAVHLKILTETHVFEAPATIVYSPTHLGMGLMFGHLLPKSQDVLQNWLPAS
ncbi:MAG: hypothetical protein DMG47_18990 [Acidobacteria bacterium]|nr:MAG: hypothetical protein DMG47_18990 [Acidobacteriota bacterium]PYT61515.1 MAG: hypothetical protein DMG46_04170 [Acidobacteriota bacterium]